MNRVQVFSIIKLLRASDRKYENFLSVYKISLISLMPIILSIAIAILFRIVGLEGAPWYLPIALYLSGVIIMSCWFVVKVACIIYALLRADDILAERTDRKLQAERILSRRLSEDYSLADLERCGREIASTIKQHEKDIMLVGLVTIVGGAITALGATPPFRVWQWADTVGFAVPAFLLGAGIGAMAIHGFTRYLLRVESVIAEAVKEKGTSAPSQM